MDPYEILAELKVMVKNITGRMRLLSEHWSDFIQFDASMPEAKDALLKYIDQARIQPREAFRETGLYRERG